MRYYILPKNAGVAITQGTYLEVHLLNGDPDHDYHILHDAENVVQGFFNFIDDYSEENILGDAVFEDIVSEDAPVFEGSFLPDTFFYKLPADFQTPKGWFRYLPIKYNDVTKPDIFDDEESERQYDEYCLRKAFRALDEEFAKPFDEQDQDLIDEAFGLIEDVTGEKIAPTEEEVNKVVKGVLSMVLENAEMFEASRPDLMEVVREMNDKLNRQS